MPTDPTHRGEARRGQLLEAALRVIARGGVGAATHRAVATEAGVPLGSTTYYFASREEMVAQALELSVERDRRALDAAREDFIGAAGPKELAQAIVTTFLRGMVDDRHVWIAGYELFIEATRRADLHDLVASWTQAEIDVLTLALERLGTREPRKAARLLVAALNGLALEVLAHGDRAELPELVEDLVRRFV